MDAHGRVELGAVAARLARVVADAAVHRGHRVVADEVPPRFLVATGLREREPALDVLARGARRVARREHVRVDGLARRERLHGRPCSRCGGVVRSLFEVMIALTPEQQRARHTLCFAP